MKSMKILPAAISVIAYATTSSSTTATTVTTSVVGVEATAVPREESSSTQLLQCREDDDDDDVTTAAVMEEVSVNQPTTHQPPPPPPPLQASTSTTSTSTTSTHGATTGTTSTDATTTTTQASVSLLLPQHPLEYYHQQWSPYPYLVRLFQYFWGHSSPSSSFLSPSSSSRTHTKKTRCLQFNHHHHHRDVKVTVSPVCHDDRHRNNDHTDTTCSSSSSSSSSSVNHEEDAQNEFCYELSEPLHLELGGRLFKHVEDYAYRPVVVTSSSSVPLFPNDDDESKLPPPPRRPDPANNMDHEEDDDDDDDGSLEESPVLPRRGWWQWWIPWQILRDQSFSKSHHSSSYRMHAFAGGSHGEIWRGRRICAATTTTTLERNCTEETLIFKRLKVEKGFRALEAGLREIHFGSLLRQLPSDSSAMFTQYVEHFFGNNGELWIVFKDHGLSLRSFLYTSVDAGGFVVFQQSWLWTLMRISIHSQRASTAESSHTNANHDDWSRPAEETAIEVTQQASPATNTDAGRNLIRTLLQQLLESVSELHRNGIVHRDIKPSNIICQSNIALDQLQSISMDTTPQIHCVLGDFSSAFDDYTSRNVYTRGPSGLEQTDEYAPPEAIFGDVYSDTRGSGITPSFDSWSIGIVALEILLGTPNVFSVDQRTRMVLSYKMKKKGASDDEIERAIYLAALSQFCIYNPMDPNQRDWPLRDGDPLHQSAMTKQTCTMTDFHRALRARDPLGWGFEQSDKLLHLIWKLLEWDPAARMTAADALNHPYFTAEDGSIGNHSDSYPGDHNAVESQMLDPRMDFNVSDSISEFTCPKCGRTFADWKSCHTHANSRKHAKFCVYDRSTLPTCLNSHAMLPAHSYSGYCDIQGRRRTIEDFHAIRLFPSQQFYGVYDGHLGNAASKYAASFLYDEVAIRLGNWISNSSINNRTESDAVVVKGVTDAFAAVHDKFLEAITTRMPPTFMDQSGTTATALLVTNHSIAVMSVGDSRAVLSTRRQLPDTASGDGPKWELLAKQLTKDHVASDQEEREMVESHGGRIMVVNGMERVMGSLVVTRSIGDPNLAIYLSRVPHVIVMSKAEVLQQCGTNAGDSNSAIKKDDSHSLHLCFLILASDGLWDTVSNQEAVDMVESVMVERFPKNNNDSSSSNNHWYDTAALQEAAEALTHEAYVRGSTDNIGVCIIAIS